MPFQVRLPAPAITSSSSQSNKRKPRAARHGHQRRVASEVSAKPDALGRTSTVELHAPTALRARRKPLTLTPGFKKGRHCKAHVESVAIAYSITGPFRSGKGSRQLGLPQRAEHLRHNYRKPAQPPTRKTTTSTCSSSKVSVHFDPHTVHFEHEASPSQLPSVKALDILMFVPRIAENPFCARLEKPMPSATDFIC